MLLGSRDGCMESHGARGAMLVSVLLCGALLASVFHTPAMFRGRDVLITADTIAPVDRLPPAQCQYGALPGQWVSTAPEGARWQLLGDRCALRNHLREYNSARNGTLRPVSLLLLSDSTDRYLLQFLCEWLQGTKVTLFDADDGVPHFNAYAFHICESTSGIRIASAYYPGVHPTGPFHMNVRHNFTRRFSTAAKLWSQHFKGAPDMVVVSSLLWDVARLYSQERSSVSRPELAPSLVAGWMANFSRVLAAAQQTFPSVRAWAYHTTLPPRHSPVTGLADKPYLCRRYYVSQLNAAGTVVAGRHGFQVVDYNQVGDRFLDGQAYLIDLIHFGQQLSLEYANLFLNILLGGGAAMGQAQQAEAPAADAAGEETGRVGVGPGAADGSEGGGGGPGGIGGGGGAAAAAGADAGDAGGGDAGTAAAAEAAGAGAGTAAGAAAAAASAAAAAAAEVVAASDRAAGAGADVDAAAAVAAAMAAVVAQRAQQLANATGNADAAPAIAAAADRIAAVLAAAGMSVPSGSSSAARISKPAGAADGSSASGSSGSSGSSGGGAAREGAAALPGASGT